MSNRPKGPVANTSKADVIDSKLRSGTNSGSDPMMRGTWSPQKVKKALANEARTNPVLAGLPPNEQASKIIEEGMNSTIKHFRMINAKENADAQFNVGGSLLYAHRAVINVRCPGLFSKCVKEKQIKKGITLIKVDDKHVDEPSLYSILHYLYSDELLFHTVEPSYVVTLLRAAQMYDLSRLSWLAERYLKAIITVDNFFTLLKVAAMNSVARAKVLCMEFGARHFKELIVRRDGVHALGLDLFREFVEFVVIPPPESKDDDPDKRNLPSTLEADFTKIYNDMAFTDGIVSLSGDKNPVRFHTSFLLETAPAMHSCLTASKDASDEHREQFALELPKGANLSAGAFRALLRFIYYHDKAIEPVHAAELVPFARQFEIASLSEVVETIIKTGIAVDSVVPILGLCYNKDVAKIVKKDVFDPALKFVLQHITEIDFKPLKKKSPSMAFDILRLCKKQIADGKWTLGEGGADDDAVVPATPKDKEAAEGELTRKKSNNAFETADQPRDILQPMRENANRGSSARLSPPLDAVNASTSSRRSRELVHSDEPEQTSPRPEQPSERRRRKIGNTKSLIETSPRPSPSKWDEVGATSTGSADEAPLASPKKEESDSAPQKSPKKEEKEPSQKSPKKKEKLKAEDLESTELLSTYKAEEESPKPSSKEEEQQKAEESKAEAEEPAATPVASEEAKPEEKPEKKSEEPKPEVEEKKEEAKPVEEAKAAQEPAKTEEEPAKEDKESKKDKKKKDAAAEEEAKPAVAPVAAVAAVAAASSDDISSSESDSRAAIKAKIKAFESQAKAAEPVARSPSTKRKGK